MKKMIYNFSESFGNVFPDRFHSISRTLCFACVFILLTPLIWGQNPILESYIEEGLGSNHGFKQRQLDYTKNLSALKEARGLFFPDVSFNARYTVSRGGRTIEFPVGDLLNPVYSTLNFLTASEAFPQIENQEFNFYRPKEHETKLSLVQPIFNTDLLYNYRIKEDYAEISRIDVNRYKRELIREITQAYYNYQKAYHLVQLADTTLLLVQENVRVSKSLFENDKVTIDAVYRSESEQSKVEVQQAETKNFLEASRAYFNFLLNRPLDSDIALMHEVPDPVIQELEEAQNLALAGREELRQLEKYQQLNKNMGNLHQGKNIPGLFGVVDYGFQGAEYRFTGDDDFMLASLVLQWKIFQGASNHQKVRQSKIEGEKLEEAFVEAEQQIRLGVINNYYALLAAFEAVQSAGKQEQSASKAYRLIDRKYIEGQSTLLELIDARTSMTNASANSIVAQNEYFIRKADFEYDTGAIDLNLY